MAVDFKQYNYPDVSYCNESLVATGCGPCSVADLLATINRDVTPVVTAQWLTDHGYASPHHGTIWGGISECLTYYGGKGRMLASGMDGNTQSRVFDEWQDAIKSGRMGILLMHNCDGKGTWTLGGHYIAIVSYDSDRYMVYDPASVARTGWHPWSDFVGNICCLYTSGIEWKPFGKAYVYAPKQVEKGFVGADAFILECILASKGFYRVKWGMEGSCGEKLSEAILTYQQWRNTKGGKLRVDGVCGTQTWGDLLGTGNGKLSCEPICGGSHGLSVLLSQEIMIGWGYYNGAIDKSFGDQCVSATGALQQKLGLPVTGAWNYTMWKKVLKTIKF